MKLIIELSRRGSSYVLEGVLVFLMFVGFPFVVKESIQKILSQIRIEEILRI